MTELLCVPKEYLDPAVAAQPLAFILHTSRQSITKHKLIGAGTAAVSHSSEPDLLVLFVGKQNIRSWCDMFGQNFYSEFRAYRYVGSKVEAEDVHTSGLRGCLLSLHAVVKEVIISVCCVLCMQIQGITLKIVLLKRKL